MSTENVRRFVQQVAKDARLAGELKGIPAGNGAEQAFVKLADREGFAFTVEDLRQQAKDAASQAKARASDDDSADRTDDGLWVLDYFYGPEGKWTK